MCPAKIVPFTALAQVFHNTLISSQADGEIDGLEVLSPNNSQNKASSTGPLTFSEDPVGRREGEGWEEEREGGKPCRVTIDGPAPGGCDGPTDGDDDGPACMKQS